MKGFKYIVFVVALVAGDFLLGGLIAHLAKKQQYDNRIGMVLDNRINADIIVLGSSMALNDYSPDAITQATGRSCYNLGFSGTNIHFHEAVLDLVLAGARKPSLIVYNIDDPATLCFKKGIIFRKDILNPYIDHDEVNERVCRELDKNVWATMLSRSYRQNVNFVNALKYAVFGREKPDFKTTAINAGGAVIIADHMPAPPVEFIRKDTTQRFQTSKEQIYALLRIIEKCRQHNVRLVFSFPPQYTWPTRGFAPMIEMLGNGVPVVNLSQSLQDKKYYYDPEHLNESGATEFSRILGSQIKASFF